GLWNTNTGLSADLTEADLARMNRQGLPALTQTDGLALLDAALASPHPALVPLHVNTAALRTRTDEIPALLRALAPTGAARRAVTSSTSESGADVLRRRLTALSPAERERALLDLVRT
ncbi:modular polyketide synthase BFAS4, partial [Streptomyces tateyamensis]